MRQRSLLNKESLCVQLLADFTKVIYSSRITLFGVNFGKT